MAKPKRIYPTFHGSVFGPQGTGKSALLTTFGRAYLEGHIDGPLLVLMFDPYGKDSTYFKHGLYHVKKDEIELVKGEYEVGTLKGTSLVIPHTDVMVKGQLATRVEYIHEHNLMFDDESLKVSGWLALPTLRKRVNKLFREEQDVWGTIGWDSATSSELLFRGYMKYVQLPDAHGEAQKKWWGESTDEHERMLCIQFAGWRKNFMVICHTDKDRSADESGAVLKYNPKLPGRLSNDLSTYFSEFYHSYSEQDEEGNQTYLLQTRPGGLFNAFSQTIGAPNPCENDYDALWDGAS